MPPRGRSRRWLPGLRRPSLQRRLALTFLGTAVVDTLPAIGIWNIIGNLWIAAAPASSGSCNSRLPWMPSPGDARSLNAATRLLHPW
jgi:hypothetical protein